MKVSGCCYAKLQKHGVTKIPICSFCGYCSEIDIDSKKYKRERKQTEGGFTFVYKLKKEK